MNTKPRTKLAILTALLAIASIAATRQGDVQAQTADDVIRCNTGNGDNAVTIALPYGTGQQLEGAYIRRKGCEQWSRNLGVITPGKSIHVFNLDDGEFEVFWRTKPHTFGEMPTLTETPPTPQEWNAAKTKRTIQLENETHRRIVVE